MEKELLRAHPSMFRNNPIGFVIGCASCLLIVGIPFMLRWWLKTKGTTLIVSENRTTLRTGILSKSTTEVMHNDVRNAQVRQSMLQRMFGVGYLAISSAGQSGIEIQVDGITNPESIKRLIDQNR